MEKRTKVGRVVMEPRFPLAYCGLGGQGGVVRLFPNLPQKAIRRRI